MPKLKNQEELSVNREHKPVRYIFALNKRIGFLDNGIALPFVLNNRIAPQEKEKYIKYFLVFFFKVVYVIHLHKYRPEHKYKKDKI